MSAPAPRVKICTDSTADIPAALARELDIRVIPLITQIGARSYRDGVDLDGPAFYRLLRATPGVPHTSQPPVGEIEAVYRELAADGADVVAIHVSGALSGTYNTCCLAASTPAIRPGAVRVIDSRSATMCLGWMAIFAARAARDGATQDAVAMLVESMVPRVHVYGLLDTLEWLHRGGRLGAASLFLGTMLAIKPIVGLRDGQAVGLERVRTKPRGMQRLVEMTRALGPLDALAVMHGDAPDEAERLMEMLAPIYPREKMLITSIGAVLGAHVGPRAAGTCCVAAAR